MSAFDDYIKTKQGGGTAVASTPTTKVTAPVSTGSPFDAAIASKKSTGVATPSPFDEAIQSKKTAAGSPTMNTLRWAGKQLMKPVSTVAVTAENIGNAIGAQDWQYIKNIPKDAWGIASGTKERSFSDVVKTALPDNPKIAAIVGFGIDVAADPLNFLGGGLTKLGRLSALVAKVDKTGQTITEGSKLYKQIQEAGTTVEKLREMAAVTNKAEQAKIGTRSALTFMDKPIIPAKASETFYKGTQAASTIAKAIPVGVKTLETGEKTALKLGDVVAKGRSLFNTSTGNAAADKIFQAAKNANEYGISSIINTSKALYKKISKLAPEELIQVSNFLEKEIVPTNPTLKEVGENLKVIYKKFIDLEDKLGLSRGELSHYAPHIPVRTPTTLTEKVKNVFGSKVWSTKLGHAENREVKKFVSESGKELIGTAKSLNLRRVDRVKGLTHDLNWGQFKTMEDIAQTLKNWGYKLVFKPQPTLHGKYLGYFSPKTREIVVASKQATLSQVMSTLYHEIVHGAHFQLAGNIEMLETFTKGGKFVGLRATLDAAKEAAKKEWVEILDANGISPETFKHLSDSDKVYYKQPTELLARVAQTYMENPAKARALFPAATAGLESLRKATPMFDILNTSVPELGEKVIGDVYKGFDDKLYQVARGKEGLGVAEHNINAAKEKLPYRFEENPAIQLAYRGISHVKATTAKQLFDDIKQFAVRDGVEVTAPELVGLKFEPGVAKQIDAYYKAIQPEEINKIFKGFDLLQNWWKGQALVSPAYHLRNMVGNFWNNHLAGVSTKDYVDAMKVQKGGAFEMVDATGKKWTGEQILEEAKKNGVINQGQYGKDITHEVVSTIKPGSYNPLSQENYLFRGNQAVGSVIENNARVANFVSQLKKGLPVQDAAMEVKKFLFDYGDLTSFEKTVLKRAMPFYTFTRKNVPLQFQQLMKQPGKYANLEKTVQAIENIGMGDTTPANEKYLSDYIKNNTSMRVNYNPKDKSYNYFLLGNWFPAYQAFDFISQPTQNILGMITPLLKTPLELKFNFSSFWRTTLDEAQDIERYPGEQVNFMGMNVTKKTATLLKNLRILSDLDKLNPGLIFGGKKGQESIWSKAGLPAVNVPLFGAVSPSKFKYTASGNQPNAIERLAGFTTGKLTSYKPTAAREYYQEDTNDRVTDYKKAIKAAAKAGDTARVRLINEKMRAFIRERGR
jgi:hypothetical protein